MPRIDIPVQDLPFEGGLAAIAWTGGDAANNHDFVNDGRTMFVMRNGDASAKTATVRAVADGYGRTQDLVLTAPAGDQAMTNPLIKSNWNQVGRVQVDLDADTSVEVAAIRITQLP